jgi:uncharacterized protein (TIGR02145 family)
MKNVLHKWLLTVVLSSLTGATFAQYVDVNRGTEYTIASTVDASGASTYQWLENGQVIAGATATVYTVPDTKPAGVYRYIRQAKSEDCTEWQSSNEFTVSVVGPAATATLVPYIDPRDGKMYQTLQMPDGKTWFAQHLNYTKDLYYNTASNVANGAPFTVDANGVPAIGSYWCPAVTGTVASGGEAICNIYGALYTWETVMMVDGKYADETRTSTAWDESWVSGNYFSTGASGVTANADKNNARGATSVKGGGRGICPPGWHVPTDLEWAQLLNAVEGNSTYTSQPDAEWWGTNAGVKLKSAATYTGSDPGNGSWQDHATNRGTNATGFGVVTTGFRTYDGSEFRSRGTHSPMWSSSVGGISGSFSNAWLRECRYDLAQVRRTHNGRAGGFAVRCVQD